MGIKVANNAFGTLASSITNSATSITLTTGQGARFPTLSAGDYFYATLIDTSNNLEIVKCTARSTDVLTVTRAQENTTARAYSAGDRIEIRITAATFEDATAVEDGEVTEAKLGSGAVTADKLGSGAVTEAKLGSGAVTEAKLGSGAVTAAKMASGAALSNLGYTPSRRHELSGTLATASGTRWLRLARLTGRFSYRVTLTTTGGWYGPGFTQFTVHRDWANSLYVGGILKLNASYADQVRANSDTADQAWWLEVRFNTIHSSSGNGSTLFDAWSHVLVEPLAENNSVAMVGSTTLVTDPSSTGYISGPVNL